MNREPPTPTRSAAVRAGAAPSPPGRAAGRKRAGSGGRRRYPHTQRGGRLRPLSRGRRRSGRPWPRPGAADGRAVPRDGSWGWWRLLWVSWQEVPGEGATGAPQGGCEGGRGGRCHLWRAPVLCRTFLQLVMIKPTFRRKGEEPSSVLLPGSSRAGSSPTVTWKSIRKQHVITTFPSGGSYNKNPQAAVSQKAKA